MKIVLAHNHYLQSGGEDMAFAAEASLLERYGHTVVAYRDDNQRIDLSSRPAIAFGSIWSRFSYLKFLEALHDAKPDVAHFHNTFPLISPSPYFASRRIGVPVVQTLHNYRLLCPSATFFRDGHPCEDCLGKTPPWPSMVHACYRGSRVHTGVVAAMLTVHRWLRTWQERVDIYVALTDLARRKFLDGGLPEQKVMVKPNFVHPDPGARQERKGRYALFVGRMSDEKGVGVLLRAWANLSGITLRIVGDGPLLQDVRTMAHRNGGDQIEVLGRRPRQEVLELTKSARYLLLPSECYENFPVVVAEAFACGVPVIASRLGAMEEIVEDGRTGLLFTPGDTDDLAEKVEWAWTNAKRMREMGVESRAEYEAKYTAERNYPILMDIYQQAIENAGARR